jgi:formylglycine-generating enzyme required for sulfatase activity
MRAIYIDKLGQEFVAVPPGEFFRDVAAKVARNAAGELEKIPAGSTVTITKPFYMGKYPVTQGQWQVVMGANPSQFKNRKHPVENVSWEDAHTFIERLNRRQGCDDYRLPTEAEWEYACRAGSTASFPWGNDEHKLAEHAWYFGNSGQMTHPVGEKTPNAWGLHDMLGNVWEWVQDWYGEYENGPVTDPAGPPTGTARVVRGGCWCNSTAWDCRPTDRDFWMKPDFRFGGVGFRLVFSNPFPVAARRRASKR